MKSKVESLVKDIAEEARLKMEVFALSTISSRFMVHGDNAELECGCHIASSLLKHLLKQAGIPCKMVSGCYGKALYCKKDPWENHCWIVVGRHIIDITATQFGIPFKVHITSVSNPCYNPMFYDDEINWRDAEEQTATPDLVEAIAEFSTLDNVVNKP
jgi:hypothetical protein